MLPEPLIPWAHVHFASPCSTLLPMQRNDDFGDVVWVRLRPSVRPFSTLVDVRVDDEMRDMNPSGARVPGRELGRERAGRIFPPRDSGVRRAPATMRSIPTKIIVPRL